MFRLCILAINRLSFNLPSNYSGGGGMGERDLVFIIVGGLYLGIMANMPLFHHGALL